MGITRKILLFSFFSGWRLSTQVASPKFSRELLIRWDIQRLLVNFDFLLSDLTFLPRQQQIRNLELGFEIYYRILVVHTKCSTKCLCLVDTVSESQPMMKTLEEEQLIAAAKLIMMELDSNKKFSDETTKILADLCTKLSSMVKTSEDDELSRIKRRLDSINDKVMISEVDQGTTKDYLKTVDDARRLVENLESLNPSKDSEEYELLRKTNDVIRTSIPTIEKLFKRMLIENKQNIDLSFWSSEDDHESDMGSIVSFEDDSVDDPIQGDGIMNLINPEVIPDLKSIANLMFDLNYGRECSEAFISVRKDAFDDCLLVLEVERTSIKEVSETEWVTLNFKIYRWIKAFRIFIKIYLASEKFLCEEIFGQNESLSSFCFSESSKASILQLLGFAEAVVVGPPQPEKLRKILDIYEVLDDLTPNIESLYPDDNGLSSRIEFHNVLNQVGVCANATFFEFLNVVRSDVSTVAFPRGGIHHLTRYVMNYVTTLVDYSNSLNTLLKDHDQDSSSYLPETSPTFEDDSVNENSSLSQLGLHFRYLMSILETNLEEKSRLYKEDELGHIFLINNVHYMAEKVKRSDLRSIFGDNWIRKHNWKVQQYAMSYERSTWSSILNLLKDEGFHHWGSSSLIFRTQIKERLQMFNTAFEEVYKSQTGWSIPNNELREDLRISISLKVIQAYRTFVGRFSSYISAKYVKYSSDDLENYLLDLFEGFSRSL